MTADPERAERERLAREQLAAALASAEEHASELRIRQIAPLAAGWQHSAELRIRPGEEQAALDVHAELSSWLQALLVHCAERGAFELHQATDRTYAGYGNLYRALVALAPHLEDVRFTIADWSADWIDEYQLAGGRLRASRWFCEDELEHWGERVVRSPDDPALRQFAVHSYLDDAEEPLRQLDRVAAPARAQAIAGIGALLDRAAALDGTCPDLWHARGRLARAAGALDEAERALARFAELAPERAAVAALDRALVAFTAGDDARARAHLEVALAGAPAHSGARLLAAHLALTPDEAAAHTAALLAAAAARLATITPLDEAQRGAVWPAMEPAEEDLVRTGQHAALLASCRARFAACAAEQRPAAAAYLLGWADIFRIRVAHDRARAESAALAEALYAAAAELAPPGQVAGAVAYCHALLLGKKSAAGVARLEAGLRVSPEHLCLLGELGAAARQVGDFARAIELLERYLAGFRRLHRGSPFGAYWDSHRNELWTAHYQRACFALYGVPPGAPRPPGRPSDEALAAAAAALAPAVALAEELPMGSQAKARAACFQVAALIAEHRGELKSALAWAERALELDERMSHAWSAKGGCLNNLGRLDEAVTSCHRALELDDEHWHAHLVLACVAAKRGRRDEALAHLRRVVARWPAGRRELADEPDLASLRDDPELLELLAAPRS
jgi:tetratricopeptide (TPR) repeat protein